MNKKDRTNDLIVKNSIKIILSNNITSIFQLTFKGIKFIILTFLKPFWFSSSNCKKGVVVPYIYTTLNMICFYISVYLFLKLSWLAATVGIKTPHIILPAISSVIGILIVLNHSMLTIYNSGKQVKQPDANNKTIPQTSTNNKIPKGIPKGFPKGIIK